MEFCEFCGNILDDNGRCSWDDCPHNAIIDAMTAAKAEDEKKKESSNGDKT